MRFNSIAGVVPAPQPSPSIRPARCEVPGLVSAPRAPSDFFTLEGQEDQGAATIHNDWNVFDRRASWWSDIKKATYDGPRGVSAESKEGGHKGHPR